MNKLQCIFTDLDDSLLNSEKRISATDLQTIHRLKEQGVYFFIASGRHPDFVRDLAHQTGTDLPMACSNGALIYDFARNQSLKAHPIAKPAAAKLKTFLDANDLPYIIYTTEFPIFTANNPRLQYWKNINECSLPEHRFEVRILDERFMIDEHDIVKFLIPSSDPKAYEGVQSNCNQNGELSLVYSGKGLLDVNAAGSSKGEGLRFLSEIFGFSLENTLALGDNYNDESMLRICGYPVCPENAEEDMKAIARHITTHHNNDPLTNAVRALFPELL